MTWNEELQHWEIQIIDDGPDVYMNPNPPYHDALSDGTNPFESIGFHPMDDGTEYFEIEEPLW